MTRHLFLLLVFGLLLGHSSASFAADAASMKLSDGFDGADFDPKGGLYYRKNAEQAAGTATFQSDVKRTGAGALKLSVKSLCPPTDDLCSERAEIWERTKLRVPYTKGVWDGFAVKFGDPIPIDDHRYLIAQWKREIGPNTKGDFSPFLALRVRNGKLFVTVESNFQPGVPATKTDKGLSCPAGMTRVWLRPDTNQMRSLVAYDEQWTDADAGEFDSCTDKVTVTSHGAAVPTPQSGWIDFAIYSQPGPDGSGHIEVFANGNWFITVKGFIGHNDKGLGANQYFKFGPYRAGREGDWTLYYDDFRRSPDCIDVLGNAGLCQQVAKE